MFYATLIVLILMGVFGARRRLGLEQALAPARDVEPFIGVLGLLWGVWTLIDAILSLSMLGYRPVAWILYVVLGVLCLVLGYVLGWPLVSRVATGGARAPARRLYDRAAGNRESLAMSALLTAALSLVLNLLA
ncbi:MAG: hypothetical protein KC635_19060 [Myxococcales bacterium]|nr:hypothetical protein [Myxococcales bacterium]MCB9735476.1 hypothetical protein [Deltaproteobacteria bacterium]